MTAHLKRAEDSARVLSTVHTLVEALKTPSEDVQKTRHGRPQTMNVDELRQLISGGESEHLELRNQPAT
jgi:hypothetical protein